MKFAYVCICVDQLDRVCTQWNENEPFTDITKNTNFDNELSSKHAKVQHCIVLIILISLLMKFVNADETFKQRVKDMLKDNHCLSLVHIFV